MKVIINFLICVVFKIYKYSKILSLIIWFYFNIFFFVFCKGEVSVLIMVVFVVIEFLILIVKYVKI